MKNLITIYGKRTILTFECPHSITEELLKLDEELPLETNDFNSTMNYLNEAYRLSSDAQKALKIAFEKTIESQAQAFTILF